MLLILSIDDLHAVVKSSSLRIYADDVTLCAEVSSYQYCTILQKDLNRVHVWSLLWHLTFNLSKCEALNVTNKYSPVSFDYTIGSSPVA